jgi:hypothetical protein
MPKAARTNRVVSAIADIPGRICPEWQTKQAR